jgi:hypothetical protein
LRAVGFVIGLHVTRVIANIALALFIFSSGLCQFVNSLSVDGKHDILSELYHEKEEDPRAAGAVCLWLPRLHHYAVAATFPIDQWAQLGGVISSVPVFIITDIVVAFSAVDIGGGHVVPCLGRERQVRSSE